MKRLLLEHLFERIAGPPVDEEQREDRTAVLVARPRPLIATGLTGDHAEAEIPRFLRIAW
jgi:hypothetical protein